MDATTSLNPALLECIEEFYRILELSVADALPEYTSGYQELRLPIGNTTFPLWDIMEKEISSKVIHWSEWSSIFHVLGNREAQDAEHENMLPVPQKFSDFNERFQETLSTIRDIAVDKITQSIKYSLQQFAENPGYVQACKNLQAYLLPIEQLQTKEECLPFFDIWNPVRMADDTIIPEILARISDKIKALDSICYPYDPKKTCSWTFSLVIRLQVQFIKTIRDRVSHLISVAENQFKEFFIQDILRRELLPIIRIHLNDTQFVKSILAQ